MTPEICEMPAAEYHGLERRHSKLENDLASMEHTFAEQAQIVSKLVVISENNANAMSRLESWVVTHEADYRAVRERLLSQEIIGNTISQRLDKVTSAFETVSVQFMNDRSRFLGAWAAAGSAGAFILGCIAVAKAFGVLG
jgi:hypothetical protein